MTPPSVVGPALHRRTDEGAVMDATGTDRRETGSCVLGLRIPLDATRSVTLALLRRSAAGLSSAIGGRLLEEALHGDCGGQGYTFYLDERRVTKGLAGNERAAVLAARLGYVDREWLADLRGDVLVLGCDGRLDDANVPQGVLEAASRAGLLRDQAAAGVDR